MKIDIYEVFLDFASWLLISEETYKKYRTN